MNKVLYNKNGKTITSEHFVDACIAKNERALQAHRETYEQTCGDLARKLRRIRLARVAR